MSTGSRIQRQAACPCGSGRRLVTCCLPLEEAFQRLVGRLLSFVASPSIRPHESDAATLFWNIQGAVRPGKGFGPEGGLRFLEWFVHDYSPKRGETLLGAFADAVAGLSPEEEYVLLASLLAPVRIYQVTPATRRLVIVRDLLTGNERALGPLGLPGPQIGSDLLVCRLLPLGRLGRPGASILVLPGACREELLAYLRTAYQLARPPRHISLEDFLDSSAHLYHHFFLSRGRNLGARGVETVRAFAFAPGRVLYRGEDLSRIRAALDRQSELERDEETGDEVRYSRVDLERGVTLSRVLVRSHEVELRADSHEDLAAARSFLETCLRGLIQPVEEQGGEPSEAFTNESQGVGSGVPGASFLARYLNRWPDMPHPLLDGRAPRDAVRFRAEREQISWLLADLERNMVRQKRLGRAAADLGPLWERLEMTPAPPGAGRPSR